jgi:flagellar biosynthetic protein FlhB
MSASERSEQATPKRRRDARKRGEVPRSTELTAAIALLGATLFFRWYGPYAVRSIGTLMRGSLGELHQPDLTPTMLQTMLYDAGMGFGKTIAPLMGVVLAIAVVSSVAQGGFIFAPTLLKPDFKRINPVTGLRRILSKRGAFDTVKSILKLAIIAAVTYPLVRSNIERFAALTGSDPVAIGAAIGAAMSQLALRTSAVYLILAFLDYGYQRWEYERKLRMTLQEVKEELRSTEGSPEIKGRIRSIQRQIARRRMMAEVPSATVVLTNPTHLAIAIRFDMRAMTAPLVVAKGAGTVAERIKVIAREHGILVMENKPLARALYESVEVGTEIPVALYEAVADVIAYVYRIRMRTA